MTYRWRAEIHVWPHSSGRGRSVDLQDVGGEVRSVEVTAHSIDKALKLAQLYADGICTNPMVWQAPIFKIERISS